MPRTEFKTGDRVKELTSWGEYLTGLTIVRKITDPAELTYQPKDLTYYEVELTYGYNFFKGDRHIVWEGRLTREEN